MPTPQMIPSIDKRISTWIELQKKKKNQDLKTEPSSASITISREFGCEGYPIAASLKEKLDRKTQQTWTIFDDALVNKIMSDHNISRHLVKSHGERAKYLDYIFSTLSPSWKSEEQTFKLMTETIFSVSQQGNAIVVGRGAFAITKDLLNCYHFRLIAPLGFRAKSYAERIGMSIEEATQVVQEKEKTRTKFLSDFLDCKFSLDNYHLVINNSLASIDCIANTIVNYIGETT
ncbi:MAG: cytidylate kinase-like family protein [Proteobacteria bacterium]|nr:cytidylate kinase-like family protein [Pseudomonadota bacterium]